MIVFPNAKINIGLIVVSKREDGYHNLETVFYPVACNDSLEIIESDGLRFTSSGIAIPGDIASNLCVRAFYFLKQDFGIPYVSIHLHKNIPIGAGLGGGSSDAAFTLKLLNLKFKLGLSDESLEDYARKLGSDCAFFVKNKPVFASERGDKFESIQLSLTGYYIVLVFPAIHISTQEAYQGVVPAKATSELKLDVCKPVVDWKNSVKNDFEVSVFKKYPSLELIKNNLYQFGAVYAAMSGSGSCMFGIFSSDPTGHLNLGNLNYSCFKLEG